MTHHLTGKKVAILATHGFEQVELFEPLEALREAGAEVSVVAPEGGELRGWNHGEWGESVGVDLTLDDARAERFDALVIPGGTLNPDHLRRDERAVDFVRRFFAEKKPVASICHGPWMLVEAGVIQGRRVTSFPSIKTDVQNAGATWVDEEVVVDQGLVTSRGPDDLPAFIEKTLEEIHEGTHVGQTA